MGGWGSGRQGGAPTVEGCASLVLRVRDVIAGGKGMGLEGERVREGVCSWSHAFTGKTAELHFRSKIDAADRTGFVVVTHRTRDREPGEPRQYRVPLVARAQPYGGLRWFFLCPVTNDRVCMLLLPNGGRIFASQAGHGLGYRSQRDTAENRAFRRAWKKRTAMGGTPDHGPLGTVLQKRYRQHRRTWWRDYARLLRDERVCLGHSVAGLRKLGVQIGRDWPELV